jgi:hypothetical protein
MLKKRKFLGSNLYCIFVPSLYFALHWYYTISVCFNSILQYDFKKCFRFYSIQLQLSVDEVCHWWNGSQQRIPTQLYHRKINQISTWLMGQCHDIFYLRVFFSPWVPDSRSKSILSSASSSRRCDIRKRVYCMRCQWCRMHEWLGVHLTIFS